MKTMKSHQGLVEWDLLMKSIKKFRTYAVKASNKNLWRSRAIKIVLTISEVVVGTILHLWRFLVAKMITLI